MSGRDQGVLYRSRIGEDGDGISHMSTWCCGPGSGHPGLVMAADGVRYDVVVDWSSVKHTLEPFGRVSELGGLGLTPTHRPDLFWW